MRYYKIKTEGTRHVVLYTLKGVASQVFMFSALNRNKYNSITLIELKLSKRW